MAVDTDTQQWATREELRALEKQVSKLEGQFSESEKRFGYKGRREGCAGRVGRRQERHRVDKTASCACALWRGHDGVPSVRRRRTMSAHR